VPGPTGAIACHSNSATFGRWRVGGSHARTSTLVTAGKGSKRLLDMAHRFMIEMYLSEVAESF